MADAVRRWEAFYAGEIIDRPVVCVTAPREGCEPVPARSYRAQVFDHVDAVIDQALVAAESRHWLGEAIPVFNPSFGPDEIGVFCGAELCWSDDSGDTNWSKPFVGDWNHLPAIRLQLDSPLWRRRLEFYRRGAERLAGKMIQRPPDLHTNMDLLASIRGPQRLCMDLLDWPEAIDQAMAEARAVFRELWGAVAQVARMAEFGFCSPFYSTEGAAILQCDFCCMMSPAMFRRWVMPALEEEAEVVRHAFFHWDGPGALVHEEDLLSIQGIHTVGYVSGSGNRPQADHVELFQRIQKAGKAVQVVGKPEQVKAVHRQLQPERAFYHSYAPTQAEAEALLDWFVKHT